MQSMTTSTLRRQGSQIVQLTQRKTKYGVFSVVVEPTSSTQSRQASSGTRGARGHGWFSNYRENKGGRHLQGEYHDRPSLEERQNWNAAVIGLGYQQVHMDVVVEPVRMELRRDKKLMEVPPLDTLTGIRNRLTMNLAKTVMPKTVQNFLELSVAKEHGYVGTSLYRVEKKVGIYGGDTLTNTGKTGKAILGQPMMTEISDPLPLWHVPGTISMLVPKVGMIDSRFFIVTDETSQHLDGIQRAFGQLDEASTAVVQNWQNTLITKYGVPTAFDLIVKSFTIGIVSAGVEPKQPADAEKKQIIQ